MLNPVEIARYLDGDMNAAEIEAFERQLLANEAGLREVLQHEQTSAALATILRDDSHVRASILAEIGAQVRGDSRRRVMREVTRVDRGRRWSWGMAGIAAGMAAAACLPLMLWLANRPVADTPQARLTPDEFIRPLPAVPETVPPPVIESPAPAPPSPIIAHVPTATAVPDPVPSIPSIPAPSVAAAKPPEMTDASAKPVPMAAKPAVTLAAPVPTVNDPRFRQPFAESSPWKQLIPRGAKMTSVRWPDRKDLPELGFRWRNIEFAGTQELGPRRIWRDQVSGIDAFMPPQVPNVALLADIEFSFVDVAKMKVLELTGVRLDGAASFVPGQTSLVDLSGDGFHGGLTASGASYLGGVLRDDEIMGPVRHALAIVIHPKFVRYSGDGFVPPATQASVENRKLYSDRGNLSLGSRLALPPEFDISRAGAAGVIAVALRDYGAYVIDVDAAVSLQLCLSGPWPPEWAGLLQPLVEELRIVPVR